MTVGAVWAEDAERVEITASLPGMDPGDALATAIRAEIRRQGFGATVTRAAGYWQGTSESATRVEVLTYPGANPDPDWQVRAIVGAALAEGCTAVQVERFPCKVEEWRASD